MTATRPLRFGIQAGPADTPYAARRNYWREAERLGYDWASVSDHFIANPVFGARETDPWNEAWTSLAALAEATSRIHIGVMVTSVGYRHPPVLAKMAATVDVISEGRLEFGIGAGYLETEYRMCGLPFPPAAGPWRAEPIADIIAGFADRARLSVQRPLVVAFDGRSSSGKTTLARRIAHTVPVTAVVHTDDIAWFHSRFGWADLAQCSKALARPVMSSRTCLTLDSGYR